jgi:deazaflavin-dependent oxidoreductase (nitroreductase family)
VAEAAAAPPAQLTFAVANRAAEMRPRRSAADSVGTVSEKVFDNPTGWVADHVRRYVESDGRRGHRFNGRDALLITTRGRRTGRLRRTALYYGRNGDRYVLVATPADGGGPPGWYLNLLESPAVVLQVRSERFAGVARPATVSERPRLWELMVSVFPKYETYARDAAGELPVVVVERA